MKANRMRVVALNWEGDHDALAAGFRVTLECGCSYWRPTNILVARGTRRSLEADGAVCRNGCTKVDGNVVRSAPPEIRS